MEASYAKSSKQNYKHAQTYQHKHYARGRHKLKRKKQNLSCHKGTNLQEAQLKGHYLVGGA